jgi:hypothetical protein
MLSSQFGVWKVWECGSYVVCVCVCVYVCVCVLCVGGLLNGSL